MSKQKSKRPGALSPAELRKHRTARLRNWGEWLMAGFGIGILIAIVGAIIMTLTEETGGILRMIAWVIFVPGVVLYITSGLLAAIVGTWIGLEWLLNRTEASADRETRQFGPNAIGWLGAAALAGGFFAANVGGSSGVGQVLALSGLAALVAAFGWGAFNWIRSRGDDGETKEG
jgi:hypothetical protein